MRVVSGIQPSGTLHLGNYFGALANWIKLQNDGNECFFFLANQHSITTAIGSEKLKENTLKAAATIIASGINPENLFLQSDVPQHSQLAWILSCLAPMGQMERMIQFKEKSKKESESTLGLFAYPVLQASDILLYKGEIVPVGIDQAQHLELARILAKKFNNKYKEIFPEPKTLHTKTTKVVGLDGTAKMSKSQNNYIGLVEDEDAIWKKLAVATTDPARVTKNDPGNPLICNIYSLHKLFSSNDDLEWVMYGCTKAKFGCLVCKKRLHENINKFIKPIRERYNELISDPEKIHVILRNGAERAKKVAQATIDEVYDLMGMNI